MGKLIEKTGSLFEATCPIGHGCNIRGAMASGIAGQFKTKYPEMEVEYKRLCKEKAFILGDVYPWFSDRVIMNLMTQENPGPDARYLAIAKAVNKALNYCQGAGTNLALPKIGCGIGGLVWYGGVKSLLIEVVATSTVDIEIWVP